MNTELSKLATAAGKWDDMAGEFKKLEEQYKQDVHGISMGQSWQGLSANAANDRFTVTLNEYKAAQKEAKAIAALLRDAHAQFVELRSKLKRVRDDAVKDGMTVSEQGYVSFDTSRLSDSEHTAYVHDPSYQESVRTAAGEWNQAITAAVKAVSDADDGVRIALEAVVIDSNLQDGTYNGFNSDAKNDVEEYEAEHAKDIATRINSGEKVSGADMSELQRSFRDNSGNREFSQTLLNGLGADGVIQLTNKLNDGAYESDKKRRGEYTDLQKGLANTVATATRVPGRVAMMPPGSKAFKEWVNSNDGAFYKKWTDELDRFGTKNYGSKTNPLYGYQSFVSMMEHGNAKFDDQFLYELGDDLIKAEKDHKGIFTTWGGGHDGIKADAIDSLLGVMSKNPDAATAFFDPAGNGKQGDRVDNNHLHYLAGSGNDVREWPRQVTTGYNVTELDDPLSRVGLGAALEAASTGHVPLSPGQDPVPSYTHSPEQARVMNATLEQLSQGSTTEVHENLRLPVSQALAEYAPDTNEILGGLDNAYAEGMKDGYFTDKTHVDRAHLSTSPDVLVQVMRGLSEDPEAYGTLTKAENRLIEAELDKIPKGASGYSESNPLAKAGATLGTFTAIREDVLNDERISGYSDADWKAKVAYHIIGGAVTPMSIPTGGGSIAVGDGLQRGVDTLAWMWGNELKADADAKANEGINDRFLSTNTQMRHLVDTWGSERYDTDTTEGKDRVQGLTKEILAGHTDGLTNARGYLTDSTN
ncbi:hypothetical protein [Streptomyces sp. NPDC059165]|uniref:hypothetical protein n=1 Tax=Streptomyces sp. NPDC059165 TaxID=3346751 RepID=UPI00369EF12D